MFGNQQNRQAANAAAVAAAAGESFTSNAEKRGELYLLKDTMPRDVLTNAVRGPPLEFTLACAGTLATSGLGGLKAALAEDDKPSPVQKSPGNAMYEHEAYSPYDKNYE